MVSFIGRHMPNLSASFAQRFDANPDGTLEPGDGIPGPSLLMAPLLPNETRRINYLSPVAKLDRLGDPVQRWNYELPPMEITGMLVQAIHVTGAAQRDNFPYSLKAVGRVDPNLIRRGGRGLVSDDFVIVP
jgi:hypothetical protein